MNPTDQLLAAVADGPCTADELFKRVSYGELCEHDVCKRIDFRTYPTLNSVYYAKEGNKANAIGHYVRSNWRELERMMESGEFKTIPPGFAKILQKYYEFRIQQLEQERYPLQDEIDNIESQINKYEKCKGVL